MTNQCVCAGVLTTAAQVSALEERDYAQHLPFSITGIVSAVGRVATFGPNSYSIDTGSGSVSLWCSNDATSVGQIVEATGYTKLDAFADDHVLFATNLCILGSGPVPTPPLLTYDEITRGIGDNQKIRIRGFIYSIVEDEVSSNWSYGLIKMDGKPFHIAIPISVGTTKELRKFIDTEVELEGCCFPIGRGLRRHLGHNLSVSRITTLSSTVEDPFSIAPLENMGRIRPERIHAMHRRKVSGRILVVWDGDKMLVKENTGRIVKVQLEADVPPPNPGTYAEVVGFPETDLYFVNLSHALYRTMPTESDIPPERPTRLASPNDIRGGVLNRKMNIDFHGRSVSIDGVVRTISSENGSPRRLWLEHDGQMVQIDVGAAANKASELALGCRIDVTGVCVLMTDNWTPEQIFPSIRDFFIAVRNSDDIRIVSTPPWWTPMRFGIVAGALLAILVAILIWNASLRILVDRRSRQLVKSQSEKLEAELRIDERTRIAAELHDYLAQNLAAMSYRLTAAKLTRTTDPAMSSKHLETLSAMLNSSRTELRRCLWDLKSAALEEPTFELAIRRTLQQLMDGTALVVKFSVSRSSVSDTIAHALLSVIRELVANAINHGAAKSIRVVGKRVGDKLTVSVCDDGCGFDPSSRGGSDDGHFGLDGIRSRTGRLGGEIKIKSEPGRGTTAVVTLPSPRPHLGKDGTR